jgi:hypothetical protein
MGGGGEKYCVLCNILMWMFHKKMEIQPFDVKKITDKPQE